MNEKKKKKKTTTVNQTINVQQLHLTNLWIFQETQFELCINL